MTASARSGPRLVETAFPFRELSKLVAADRRLRDPVYGLHRWFARRPPTLVRALLLASYIDARAPLDRFWRQHATCGNWLAGATVYDPFMGGGTSLVEAARMGASVAGRDVDPLATTIVATELDPSSATTAVTVAREMLAVLTEEQLHLFGPTDSAWMPLHWFWLRRVSCPKCDSPGLVYRDLVIATSTGRMGSVVRDDGIHAFCPVCLAVHALPASRKTVICCGRRFRLNTSTYGGSRYACNACGERSTHERLATGKADRILLAVEETAEGSRRRIRSVTRNDQELVDLAREAAAARDDLVVPRVSFETDRRDRRPVSLGFTHAEDLFTERQWLLLGRAFGWLNQRSDLDEPVRRAVTLMLTGCLASNTVLCGYAREYGRLAPLFSVRGYALPALSVELNALHPTAGRGTLASGISRIARAGAHRVYRHRIVDGVPRRESLDLPVRPGSVDVVCASADDPGPQSDISADVCVTDPPYFDYIAYSELSEVYRIWLDHPGLGGSPLLPRGEDPTNTFAEALARCLKVTRTRLAVGTPIVFTYHSPRADAWEAIGAALDEAGLRVTAVWPVLADPHMGHHAAAGNCEWDIVVCCRGVDETIPRRCTVTVEEWLRELADAALAPGPADIASFRLALLVARQRFSQVRRQVRARGESHALPAAAVRA